MLTWLFFKLLNSTNKFSLLYLGRILAELQMDHFLYKGCHNYIYMNVYLFV